MRDESPVPIPRWAFDEMLTALEIRYQRDLRKLPQQRIAQIREAIDTGRKLVGEMSHIATH